MVARVKDLAAMPSWPRMLSRDQAAAYLGVSAGTFLREVAHGKWPLPMERGSRKTWDRVALDRVLDQSAGLLHDARATHDEWLAKLDADEDQGR